MHVWAVCDADEAGSKRVGSGKCRVTIPLAPPVPGAATCAAIPVSGSHRLCQPCQLLLSLPGSGTCHCFLYQPPFLS